MKSTFFFLLLVESAVHDCFRLYVKNTNFITSVIVQFNSSTDFYLIKYCLESVARAAAHFGEMPRDMNVLASLSNNNAVMPCSYFNTQRSLFSCQQLRCNGDKR